MNCRQTVELFDSYTNGTISLAEKQALESHIKTCEDCRKQLELYRIYFSDVTIENDFLVPSQLNAKIKYAIHQAKETKEAKEAKKIPFWQNQRLLSTATACAFLFVAGIWGASNYSKLQNAASTPSLEITQPVAQETLSTENQPSVPLTAPAIAKDSRQVTPEPVTNQESTPKVADVNPVPEHTEDVAAYSDSANITADTAAEPFAMPRTMEVPEDISLNVDMKDTILSHFPHEVITEDIFLVTITKPELENLLGHAVDTDETKTQLFIRFTSIEQ